MLASLVLALAQLVKIFSVVNDAANGRLRLGRNFHQIKAATSRNLESFKRDHDTQLVAFFINQPHLAGANPLINTNESVADK